MRSWLRDIAALGFSLCMCFGGHLAVAWDAEVELVEEARELLRGLPLIDGHNDAPYSIRHRVGNRLANFDFRDTTVFESPMHTDLGRLRAGGVGGQFWSVWVPTDLDGGEAVTQVLEQIDLVHRLVAKYPDDLEIALTAADIRRIHAVGRVASLIGVEGGHSIDESLGVLRQLYGVGARYMTLTHWDNVSWADAATDKAVLGGLAAFGEAVVAEMNRLGMLVDLSHVSAAVMHEALDISRAPVIFSHSNAAAINPHPRNVPDDVLRRMPSNGGVVMVNFGSFFVSAEFVSWRAAQKAERTRLQTLFPGEPESVDAGAKLWLEGHPATRVTVAQLADHVDHIRKVAGIDHVGLGSDFDGVGAVPEGLEDVSKYPVLLAELLRRGYTRDEVAKVAGLNVLRVMERAEQVAAKLQVQTSPIDLRIEDVAGKQHEEGTSK